MANKKIIHVEILCKNIRKSQCKTIAKICVNFLFSQKSVQKIFYPPTFPTFSTLFPTTPLPLKFNYYIHYSTTPTITTTNN